MENLTKQQFAEECIKELKLIGESNYVYDIKTVTKNNGTKATYLVIKSPEVQTNVNPLIKLDVYFEDFCAGVKISAICKDMLARYQSHTEPLCIDIHRLEGGFDEVRDSICVKIINTDANKDLLENIPYIPYLDLSITFYILIGKEEDNVQTAQITNQMIKSWNVDANDLLELAIGNTQRNLRGTIRNITSVLRSLFSCAHEIEDNVGGEFFDIEPGIEDSHMCILSNNTGINGSAAILYQNLLKAFSEKVDADLIILPSSVHELIILKKYDQDILAFQELKAMVTEINRTGVAPEEVLSDSVYIYKRDTNKLEIAC